MLWENHKPGNSDNSECALWVPECSGTPSRNLLTEWHVNLRTAESFSELFFSCMLLFTCMFLFEVQPKITCLTSLSSLPVCLFVCICMSVCCFCQFLCGYAPVSSATAPSKVKMRNQTSQRCIFILFILPSSSISLIPLWLQTWSEHPIAHILLS